MQNGPRKGARKGRHAATQKRANASKRGRLRKQWRKGGAEGVFASLGLKRNKKHSSTGFKRGRDQRLFCESPRRLQSPLPVSTCRPQTCRTQLEHSLVGSMRWASVDPFMGPISLGRASECGNFVPVSWSTAVSLPQDCPFRLRSACR